MWIITSTPKFEGEPSNEKAPWKEKRTRLKESYPYLKESDLDLEEGKEDEMLDNLHLSILLDKYTKRINSYFDSIKRREKFRD
jgi:hypothetical protein